MNNNNTKNTTKEETNAHARVTAVEVLARFRMLGGRVHWLKYSEAEARAKFTFDGNAIELGLTIAEAQARGLMSYYDKKTRQKKELPAWRSHPAECLRGAVVKGAVKMLAPECLLGEIVSAEAMKRRETLTETTLQELEFHLEKDEREVNRFLQSIGWLAYGQNFRDLTPLRAEQVLARVQRYLAEAKNFNEKGMETV